MIRLRSLYLILCLAVLAPPARVLADGFFVWKNRDIDILEPEQKALIFYDRGREDLVLSVRFDGAPGDFGWIVPLPSIPEMFPEDSLLFSVLSQATQERWYERSQRGRMLHATLGVEVLSSQQVGIYEARVVEASAGGELHDWLALHGYRLPPGAESMLDSYIRDGWVFATLKIGPSAIDSTATARLRSGTIPPIRFRFSCPEPVFPMEISSVMFGGAEVLLYVLSRDITVPRIPKPESWTNQINCRPGEHHWIYQYEQDHRTTKFLPHYQEPFYLTKHRGHFDAADMKDVYFAPYDPAHGLRSSSEAERLEAIANLGRIRPAGALGLVMDHLRAEPTRTETFSLLWALGELGGPEAERALLANTEAADPEVRIEAVEGLGRMESHAALPYLIRGLESGTGGKSPEDAAAWRSFRMACFQWLVALGDSTCLGELRRMAEEHAGAERWDLLSRSGPASRRYEISASDRDVGLLAVAALAACGEETARGVILRAIVAGGQRATVPEALTSAASSRGTINDFPSGFWTGLAALRESSGFRDWDALTCVYSLFRTAPALRSSLLEQAAADPRLPRSGVIVLLANVDSLRAAAADRLMQIWHESIREPRRYVDVQIEFPRRSPPVSIRYNHDACAIAYALSRHNRVEELGRLWSARPANDPVLEGELVFAMAESHDPRFRQVVWDYVRRVWGKAARSEAFEQYVAESILNERASRRLFHYSLSTAPFDLGYRVRSIWNCLLGHPPDVDFEKTLLIDRGLPPYLRLAVLSQPNYFAEPRWRLLPVARTELDALRMGSAGQGGLTAQIADSLYRQFQRTTRRIDELKGR